MPDTTKILEALSKLDVNNSNHWTADGLPRLDTVKMLAGDQALTREAISLAAPGFSRSATAGTLTQQGQGGNTGHAPIATPAAAVGPASPVAVTPAPAPSPLGVGGLPEKQTEQLAVADPARPATDEITMLEEEVKRSDRELTELQKATDEVKAELTKTQNRNDQLHAKLDALRPPPSTGNVIQGYLASQRKSLEDRAARQHLIRSSGIDLRELARNLKAPIDAAMARSFSRGTKRPA
jgi:hypothetical protein